jgi:hypothetical protein
VTYTINWLGMAVGFLNFGIGIVVGRLWSIKKDKQDQS